MAQYHVLSDEIQERIREDRKAHWDNPYACRDEDIIRRQGDHDRTRLWRPAFVMDVEKIMHNPYYNRYSDKTQVFSFYKNDDISRRALHVQLVSRIARNIGRALHLNEDLIEAIALGHDIGHTPFGHAGERMLNDIYRQHTGRFFNHNVHSVRVLDKLVQRNVSFQVLDGVLCHNGELELSAYRPARPGGADGEAASKDKGVQCFKALDARIEDCYTREEANREQIPCTLEGCVMRVSDIIAYLGKDRQDAERLGLLPKDTAYINDRIGTSNAEIINNMIVNIIEYSYGKDCLCMTADYFEAFSRAKNENYKLIYRHEKLESVYQGTICPMCEQIYECLLKEAEQLRRIAQGYESRQAFDMPEQNRRFLEMLEPSAGSLFLFQQYIKVIYDINAYSQTFDLREYLLSDANDIIVDFIASMTDDYFIDLYDYLFPDSKLHVEYQGYFG